MLYISFISFRYCKLIPCWQNMLIIIDLMLVNKDVFEPHDSGLKFSPKPQLCLHQPNSSIRLKSIAIAVTDLQIHLKGAQDEHSVLQIYGTLDS